MGRTLIVGGDSKIAQPLMHLLASIGFNFDVTGRARTNRGRIKLDLGEDVSSQLPLLTEYESIVILAAVTSEWRCLQDAEYAFRVNVEAPCIIARMALAKGKHVLFVSSDAVFGGNIPFATELADKKPKGVYAQTKADAEDCLLRLDNALSNLAILRLTKVIHPTDRLFVGWRDAIKKGIPVEAFDDLFFSPVSATRVAKVIARIVLDRMTGFFHYGGQEEISYSGFAKEICRHSGVSTKIVREVSGRERDELVRKAPVHASLMTSSRLLRLGFLPQSLRDVLSDLLL